MSRPTALVLMFGHTDGNDAHRMVQDARLAATNDLLQRGGAFGWDRIIFCSNRPEVLAENGLKVERVANYTAPFHFGRELQALVERLGLCDHGVLYVGGGLPLLGGATLHSLQVSLAEANGAGVTNNLHSCDFAGWAPGGAIMCAIPPDTDNDLAWQLRRAGLEMTELPRCAETIFDIDTPTDLALLLLALDSGAQPSPGPRLSALLRQLPLERDALTRTLAVLRDFEATALCSGRISQHSWAYFAQKAACHTRIISEERGMRASGRLARGEVRSLLGFLADRTGFDGAFEVLGQLAGAIILDTRVLMAHAHRWPTVEDRFYSDLGQPEAVRDPWLRRLTEAAAHCPAPVIMGGHSLVSGGLYLLGDAVGTKEYPLVKDVVIVCKGNTCRSPMAVALLREMLRRGGHDSQVAVRSAGIWATEGQTATADAQRAMQERGLDISRHRSHLLTTEDLRRADLLVTMEAAIAEALRIEAPWATDKLVTLGDLADDPRDIDDPIGRGIEEYRRVVELLQGMLQRAYTRIVATQPPE